jgi:soluble lytic murein transglycosylase
MVLHGERLFELRASMLLGGKSKASFLSPVPGMPQERQLVSGLQLPLLDSLRVQVGLLGISAGDDLGDTLRWRLLELSEPALLPSWGRGWLLARLGGRNSMALRERSWERLREADSLPSDADSVEVRLLAVRLLSDRGQSEGALSLLGPLLKAKQTPARNQELVALHAELLFDLGRWDPARREYQKMVERAKKKPAASDLLQLARCWRNLQKPAQASAIYERFRALYPAHEKTAEMIWSEAIDLERAEKWEEATAMYRKIDGKLSESKRREWVEFRVAFIEFKRGRWTEAIAAFAPVTADPLLVWPRDGAMLLTAECYRQLGQDSLARIWYLKTIEDFPVSWYAYRARTLLHQTGLLQPGQIPRLAFPEAPDDSVVAWLRHIERPNDTVGVPVDSLRMEELELLLVLERGPMVRSLLQEEMRRWRGRQEVRYRYSRLLLDRGWLTESHRLARQMLIPLDRRLMATAPRRLMELFYPRPWWDEIRAATRGTQLDPLFVVALMRQESTFDDQITSPAGAMGLMQIMPATGRGLATREGIAGFRSELLRNPLMAIRLGTRYLEELWGEWDADPRWVLGNYNAGPAPARKWATAAKGQSWEVTAEEVSYWETRDYIKKVMGNWWTYQLLWAGR